ncbi:hypothetical protein [Sphaerisporangium sp. NPDC051011]|uniref:hypothetical protein n=1 Tax=Sphaerisporangium sp. NPDC051011 TaxID=3155792 RepID=UPI0033D203E8
MAYQHGPGQPPYGQPPYGPPPGYGYPPPPPPPRPGRGPLFWLFAVGLPVVVLFSCTAALVTVGATGSLEPTDRLPAAQRPSTAAPPPSQPAASEPATVPTAPTDPATQPPPATQPSQPPPATQPSQAPPATQPSQDPASQPGARRTLLTDNGNGTKNTAQFTVDASWELHYTYNCSGDVIGTGIFSARITEGTSLVDLAANETGKSADKTTPQYRAGTFHLEITASCPWTIEVIDVP